ncbi:hypothetical protein EIP91_003052 [Steccherinum ochraceum]|uniref:F-box domain-containing protein n=1 Tax=Steccherinum ochraceum TaxID=92696 RepID=A0A4R0RB08_9APHY|nr:hypothetical protein EIP91_003052 [Steccherinum ochraceum]
MNGHTRFADVRGRSLEWLEAELKAVQAQAAVIREEYNARAPACTLPAELLLEIFLLAQAIRHKNTVKVAHVCLRWRSVALASQQLWSYIVPSRASAEWTSVWIQRAGTAPLQLRWYWPSNHGYRSIDIGRILPYTHRCAIIDIELPGDHMLTFVNNATFDWTILRHLFLARTWSRDMLPTIQFPTSLTGGHYQPSNYALRFLSLDTVIPNSWTHMASVCRNLRTLRLIGLSDRRRQSDIYCIDLAELLHVLESASSTLEELLLVRCEPKHTQKSSVGGLSPCTVIDFPRLRTLCIASQTDDELGHMLSHLSVPVFTNLHFHLLQYLSHNIGVSLYPQSRPDRAANQFMNSYERVNVFFRDSWTIIVAGHLSPAHSPAHQKYNFERRLKLILNGSRGSIGNMGYHTRTTLYKLGPVFSLGPVKEFIITVPIVFLSYITVDDWRRILRPFHRHLTTLLVEEDPKVHIHNRDRASRPTIVSKLLQALSSADPPLLPKLAHLAIMFAVPDGAEMNETIHSNYEELSQGFASAGLLISINDISWHIPRKQH